MSCTVKEAAEKPDRLLLAADLKRSPRSFRVSVSAEMGLKRGRGTGSFIDVMEAQVFAFYRAVIQNLRAWRPSPPRLAEPPAVEELAVPSANSAATEVVAASDPEGGA